MISPLAYLAPWWLALRYGLRWPRRSRALEAEHRADSKASVIATCLRLSPGSVAWFSAAELTEAYGSTAMAKLALIVSVQRLEDYEMVIGRDDSLTVTRRPQRQE